MRRLALALLLFAAPLWAEPPALKLPVEVHGNSTGFIVVTAETPAKAVKWVPIDAGLSLLPPALLRDSKSAVLMAPKGRYRLLAYCAVADEASEPAIVTIIVDGGAKPPPIVEPPPPPETPPAPPTTGQVWAVVIQNDGPLPPGLAANRKDPAWERIKAKGVYLSWVERSFADPSYRAAIESVTLPALFVLRVKPDGKAELVKSLSLPSPAEAEKLVAEVIGK
jgi:hypothetical protein